MKINLENIETDLEIETDVCIIGGGVAGQTLASELVKSKLKVSIVESGGEDFRRETQSLTQGKNLGLPYYDLETTRLRMFGGTAAIWGGRCAELDPIDFEKRDYIPASGWPITRADLDPYYNDVFASLGLNRPTALWDKIGRQAPPFDKQKIESGLWVFDEEGERFTDMSRQGLEDCEIILNATVTDIVKKESGVISQIKAKSFSGRVANIKAKVFVLAAGAIESARLLLAAGGGLGNQHDMVGRYFMEHPHARGGEIVTDNPASALSLLPRALRHGGKRYAAYLRPSENLQRERGILNTSLSITMRRREGEAMESYRSMTNKLKHDLPSSQFWRKLYKTGKSLAVKGLEKTDPWSSVMNLKMSRGRSGIFAVIRAEQSPNYNSRIQLSSERDAMGVPQANLDWQLQDIDKRSVRVLMETLGEELRRLGHGDVKPSQWLYAPDTIWKTDPLISAHPIGGYHHMGGLRMSANPRQGVVDANCKLHDSPNLYVAGSSVFPTGGWANPTITIMSLALRLGVHLRQKLIL